MIFDFTMHSAPEKKSTLWVETDDLGGDYMGNYQLELSELGEKLKKLKSHEPVNVVGLKLAKINVLKT